MPGWAAFNECLSDMDWLPAVGGYLVVVVEPGEVLAVAADADLAALIQAIGQASETYAQPIDSGEWWDRPAVPFQVVLQCSASDSAAVRTRWQAAGASIGELIS